MASRERLAAEFDATCRRAIEECRTLGYHPTAWAAMVDEHGAADAAKRLLISGDIQSGFERLTRMGRVNLTIELEVLDPHWDRLFGTGDRNAAWWRLQQAGKGEVQ